MAGVLGASVSGARPIVYRTPIPYTVTNRSAETFFDNGGAGRNGNCRIIAGHRIQAIWEYGYEGAKAHLVYCDLTYPGPSILFDGWIERFNAPMQFKVDGPAHWTNPALQWNTSGDGAAYASSAGPGRAGSYFEERPDEPTAAALMRVAIDAYGYCASSPYGQTSVGPPWGSTSCGAHHGTLALEMIDNALETSMRPR